jgi:hypothetical protein
MSQAPTANPAAAAGPTIEIRSSRVWALFRFDFTRFVFPSHLSADRLGISLIEVRHWLTPWTRQDEHLPMSHLAEVTHQRGFMWDSISIESSGGLNPLQVQGLRKGPADRFVNQVRTWMNV